MGAETSYPDHPVAVVDDEVDFLRVVRRTLGAAGITHVQTYADGRELLAFARSQPLEAVLLDMNMPAISGREVLATLGRERPEVPVIIVTAVDAVASAVESMRAGAIDYLVKPIDPERLVASVQSALRVRETERESRALADRLLHRDLSHPEAFASIVTQDQAMQSIFLYLEAVCASRRPILVTGETGTGKQGIAEAVHALSGRTGPLVAINTAGIDEHTFADSLFGHTRGAFTGAEGAREGLVARAENGSLFLDEIGDLPAASQVKLLNLLQDRQYYPLGSDVPRRTSTRIVAATNRDLTKAVEAGAFRRDLFFRLQTHHVHLPPLRERRGDVPLLVSHFVQKAADELERKPPRFPPELVALLSGYRFPGNIRELEGMVLDAVSVQRGAVLSLEPFLERIQMARPAAVAAGEALASGSPALRFPDPLPTLKQTEELLVAEAIARACGNQRVAASLLGITRQALNNRLRRRARLEEVEEEEEA